MKLRIRSMESKETLKIQLPSPSSLQDLKLAIAQTLTAASADRLQLSLNRKDLIDAAPHESLQSIGIASGDLVFYTENPNGFLPSGESLIHQQQQQTVEHGNCSNELNMGDLKHGETEGALETLVSEDEAMGVAEGIDGDPNSLGKITVGALETLVSEDEVMGVAEGIDGDLNSLGKIGGALETLASEDEIMGFSEGTDGGRIGLGEAEGNLTLGEGDESMELPEENEEQDVLVENLSSVPSFLKKVLNEEAGNTKVVDYKLLVIAVHAVLLESGFVCFDSKTRKEISGFHLPEGWASECGTSLSVKYTVPELLNVGGDVVETVVLKFMTWGKFVKVYGSLSRNGVQLYQLCLDISSFVPSIDFVGMNNAAMDDKKDGSLSKSCHESNVFEFWKIAKDKLALPLLIDLCEKTGLPSPPCFMRLPSDLKLKILELLPGVDIAKFGCACSELRYLASNNDLWRQKLVEEFPFSSAEEDHWKLKFVKCWETAKRRAMVRKMPRRDNYMEPDTMIFRPREPRPLLFPAIIGGDYDAFPAPFGSFPVFPAMPGANYGRNPRRRSFVPNCNLGGRNI